MGQTAEELYLQELKEAKLATTLGEVACEEPATCRFCWSAESTEENPCIRACNCSGSVGFIHLDCLRMWLGTKLQRKESDHLISLYWKFFECEICKTAYPYLFKTQSKRVYKLVDMQLPPACN